MSLTRKQAKEYLRVALAKEFFGDSKQGRALVARVKKDYTDEEISGLAIELFAENKVAVRPGKEE